MGPLQMAAWEAALTWAVVVAAAALLVAITATLAAGSIAARQCGAHGRVRICRPRAWRRGRRYHRLSPDERRVWRGAAPTAGPRRSGDGSFAAV